MISGAGDIVITDDDSGSDNNSSGQGGSPTTGPGVTVGAGGDTSGPGPSTTAGTTSATTVATTGATTGASTSSGGDNCMYPAGPYGVAEGQTVPPTITWQGYAAGASQVSTVSIQDFFDCDGTKGINALMVETSQYG